MKRTYLYIISALILGLVSCQQGGYEAELAQKRQMRFNVTAGSTRAVNDIFEEGDKIGVYVTDTPMPLQVSGNRANNEAVVYNGEKWATERPIYWGEGKSDIYAYYPYIDNVTDVDELPFSIATDQDAEGAYEASDLLWAKTEGVAQTDGAVQLDMKHIMSRLVVRIMAGEDYKGSLPKDATVHLHSTVTDVLFSFDNGSVVKDPYAGAKSIKMRNRGIHTFADGEAMVYEAIVAPQMLLGIVPLLEINYKSVSYLLEDSFNFQPGISYTYTVTLNSSITSIKIDIGCEMDDWNNIGGGSNGNGGGTNGDGDDVDLSDYTNLSIDGSANCYLVKSGGNYKFKAVIGNTENTVGNVKKVDVLWETFGTDVMPNVGDLITNVGYQNGYIYFSTAEKFNNGNASIAARNSKGIILWSWHIWCSEEGWTDQVYPNNAGTMMDRNLGATSATPGDIGAFGLLYQWGRKDPFMGACTAGNNSLAASTGRWNLASSSNSRNFVEENPMTFASDWKGDVKINDLEKGIHDPCPVGYRVPKGGFNGFYEIALSEIIYDSTNYGTYCTLADAMSTAWYPAVGYRESGTGKLNGVCTTGYCWSSSPIYEKYVSGLHYKEEYATPTASLSGGCAYSVRCIKDVVTKPTSEPEPDSALSYIDLSAAGTANCYLVKSAGDYKFKTVKGNSDTSVGNVAKVRVLWETFGTNTKPKAGDLIAAVSYKDGYVYFSTPFVFANGNASIAVCNSSGEILWSWHIWCTEEGWTDQIYPNNAGTMMDRNLGATSATPGDIGAFGLLYQWGRKDPFIGGCSTSDNTLASSAGCWRVPADLMDPNSATINPMTFSTYSSTFADWFTSEYKKGLYDPCPVGYRVPYGSKDGFWATALGTSSSTSIGTTWDSINKGRSWTLADGITTAWYPATGNRWPNLREVGSVSWHWSASVYSGNSDGYVLYDSATVRPSHSSSRSRGCSVRCVKE